MRRLFYPFAGLCLAIGLVQAGTDKKEAATCGSFGTTVEFVETPKEAAAQAKKEQKLVFVLHVSGSFEDPRFT
jgi:hypothetical protein